jgi:hypothetical protein
MATVQVDINVSDVAAALAFYNVIRVRKSLTDIPGSFIDLTQDVATAARLLAPTSGSYAVVGESIDFQIDDFGNIVHIFTGVNPLTVGQVRDQINALSPGIAAESGGALQLTSLVTGTQSSVTLPGGNSLADFGWTAGTYDQGEDAHIPLVLGTSDYAFYDRDSIGTGYYQTSFYHTGTALASAWSASFTVNSDQLVADNLLSIATIDLVDASGAAVVGQEVSIYPMNAPTQIAAYWTAIGRAPLVLTTNDFGHAEGKLARGATYKVVIENTSFIREIVVPAAVTFDLLGAVAVVADNFQVATPDVPFAIRRS